VKIFPSDLPEVLILEPKVFGDERGFFLESYNEKEFRAATGLDVAFVQDNHSRSSCNVLRGIHYQVVRPQGKLVRVVQGTVFDVAVDLRRSSSNFGRWVGVELSEQNKRQVWIPPGFGHGFLVRSERADFLYKTTDYWFAEHDRALRWNDQEVGIEWPLDGTAPIVSARDAAAPPLAAAEVFT
jgi:dTDP-4-dehydrorhamnose 3,5-epimerase